MAKVTMEQADRLRKRFLDNIETKWYGGYDIALKCLRSCGVFEDWDTEDLSIRPINYDEIECLLEDLCC